MADNAPLPTLNELVDDLERNSHIDPSFRADEMGDTDCTICTESVFEANEHVGSDGDLRHLRCGHMFHKGCISKWLIGINPNRNRCPNCRETLAKLNLLNPEKEAQWQAEEYARMYTPSQFNVGMYTNIMELVDSHFDQQRFKFKQQKREDYVRIISDVRSHWTQYGFEGLRCCQEHVRMEWDWFEFEVAKRVWSSLLKANLEKTQKANLFSAFYDAMANNLHDNWFNNGTVSEAGNEEAIQEVEENAETVEEGVGPDTRRRGSYSGADDARPRDLVDVPHNDGGAEVGSQASLDNVDDAVMIQDSLSRGSRSNRSNRSERRQQRGTPGPERPARSLRHEALVYQDAGSSAPVSHTNMRRHNAQQSAEVRDNLEDNDTLVEDPTPSVVHRAHDSALTHNSVSTLRSRRRPSVRSPAARRQDRLDAAPRNRVLLHLQQSQVLQARRELEHNYIVLDVVQNAGQVRELGNMDWQVLRNNGEYLCEVSGAIGYHFVGGTAMFYRNKT